MRTLRKTTWPALAVSALFFLDMTLRAPEPVAAPPNESVDHESDIDATLAVAELQHAALPIPLVPIAPPPGGGACKDIAFMARHASLVEIRAEFLFALANCVNDGESYRKCLKELLAEYREARALVHAQFRERLKVCDLVGKGRYDPDIDPEDFTPKVTNKYFPLVPGRTLIYRKKTSDGVEIVETTTLRETVEIAGVECAIVRDVAKLDGELIEDTIDWYSQDKEGNVWYFGEIARNYEDGFLTDLGGSWMTGRDSAKPGFLMLAQPKIGVGYRQEFFLNEAEDIGRIVAFGKTVVVPAGKFENCLQTEDWSPIEPGVREFKFYAPGVGAVLEVNPETGERLELINMIDR